MGSTIESMRVRKALGEVRELQRQAQEAAAAAAKDRARLLANPDGTRGELTAEQYRKQTADRSVARVQELQRQAQDRWAAIGADLRDLSRRARTYTRSSTDAWAAKVRPMLESGAKIEQVIAFALAHDDGDMLAALHEFVPSHMACPCGHPLPQVAADQPGRRSRFCGRCKQTRRALAYIRAGARILERLRDPDYGSDGP
jgi:hypothetical protein